MYAKVLIFVALVAFSNAIPLKFKNPRIVGGNETTIEKHPWQVSLQLFGLHSCGGSILNETTIVTAAHCADPLMPLFYTVVAGTTELNDANLTRANIASAVTHEKYDNLDWDVAIITLTEPLTLSDKIQPVKLPEGNSTPAAGTNVIVSGWGVTYEGGIFTPNELREVQVQIVDHAECAADYEQFDEVTDRMVCAAVTDGGKDACQGDSGGPLTTEDGTLVGIVSWGVGCAEKEYPGVYTDVSSVRDWIKEKTGL